MKSLKTISLLLIFSMLLALLAGCGSCDHKWQAANCQAPMTCALCSQTKGEPTNEHSWEEATTDAPKTCKICGLTEGAAIDVDDRFSTEACKEVFGNWVAVFDRNGADIGLSGLTISTKRTMHLSNDGVMTITTELNNKSAFEADMTQFLSDMMYQNYTASGMSNAEANAACQAQFGKNIADYCAERASGIAANMRTVVEMVYYVEEGQIFCGEDWGSDMTPSTYEMKDGSLMYEDAEIGQTLQFRKAAIVK